MLTALDRAKAAQADMDSGSMAGRMRAAGVRDAEAIRIAELADIKIACLRMQLEAKGVQLDIARRAAERARTVSDALR